MKKQLLASTMLVAAGALTASGAAEAKFDVSVNGYFETVIGTTIADNEDVFQLGGAGGVIGERSVLDEHNEMEIHFNAKTELDNGIKIRAHVELEGGAGLTESGPRGTQDIIDEQYVVVQGNFGQLTLGSEDNAGHLMTIGFMGSWATGVGQNLSFDVGDFITRPYAAKFDGTLNDPRLRSGDNDSDKITYYTPRFAGFQLGASYIPNVEQDANGSQASTDSLYHDGYAFGVNFVRKFDKIGIGTGFGYLHMNNPDSIQDAAGKNRKDGRALAASLRVDFGPVRLAGGFKRNINIWDSNGRSSNTSLSGTIFDVGARLTMGPNRFSVTYSHGEMRGDVRTPADREEDQAMVSYARQLGPGVKWSVNVIYGRQEGDASAATITAAEAANGLPAGFIDGQESEGVGLSTALRLNF